MQAITLANGLRQAPVYGVATANENRQLATGATHRVPTGTLQAMYERMESEIEELTKQVADQADHRP